MNYYLLLEFCSAFISISELNQKHKLLYSINKTSEKLVGTHKAYLIKASKSWEINLFYCLF